MPTTITQRVSGNITADTTARVTSSPTTGIEEAVSHRILLSGAAQTNGDVLLLSGAAQTGSDAEALSGGARGVTANHTTRVIGL